MTPPPAASCSSESPARIDIHDTRTREQNDGRLFRGDQGERGLTVSCLAEDELELVIAGERRGDPEPKERVVVDDQNSHRPPPRILLAHLHRSDPHSTRPLRLTDFNGDASAAVPQGAPGVLQTCGLLRSAPWWESQFRLSKGGGGGKARRRSGRLRGTTAAHAYLGAGGLPRRLSSRGGE